MSERTKITAKTPETKKGNPASKTQRSDFSQPTGSPYDHIMFLQRTIGNQAVQRLLKGTGFRGQGIGLGIQAKLRIGQPNDVYEQEADRVADAVMRMSENTVVSRQPSVVRKEDKSVQTKPTSSGCSSCKEEELIQPKYLPFKITPLVQRQPEEEEILHTKEGSGQTPEVTPNIESRINALRGGGQPLPESVRTIFEPRFGHDFSQIPLHPTARTKIQPKLTVSTPGDMYEQEADRTADQVMRTSERQLQRACPCGGWCPMCQSQTEQLAQKKERLQAKRVRENDSGDNVAPPIVHEVLRSPDQPLDPATRDFMESQLGHDFRQVRVHTDANAAESARAVNARAYTLGRDIVFATGQYTPGTKVGQRLLAHELAHVIQQSAESVRTHSDASVQRQETGRRPRTSAPPLLRDPGNAISRVVEYIRGQVDNWHEGARQGTTQFYEYVQKKGELRGDFWLSLIGNVIWAVGRKTPAGLIGIAIGAFAHVVRTHDDLSSTKQATAIYEDFLKGINDARSKLTEESRLESYARGAIYHHVGESSNERWPFIEAWEARDTDRWTIIVSKYANVPDGRDINTVKRGVFTELLKRWFNANVRKIELIYVAMQPTPQLNIQWQDWPEVARLIYQGDSRWHIYNDRTIVLESGGRQVTIPPDHRDRAQYEELVQRLEKGI